MGQARLGNGPPIGQPLPELVLTDLGGQPFDLARLRGRVVVLNLWATWCLPCREEMPELQELQARHDPAALSVVGVSVDTGDPAGVLAFLEDHGYGYRNLMGDLLDLTERLDVDPGIPHTFLIDRAGLVRGYWRGRFHPFEATTAALLRKVLEEG
ncbi:MAG: TlpA disulfide reductase family protein [Gemmatimonadota bacterium]|nr:TlpA disulfide reductase family protein [Gemmatimonadota bacterium]